MSLTNLLVRDVTIITPTVRTDGYGDSQPNWTGATETTAPGWLAQSSSSENRDGRNSTSTTLGLFLPAGTVITAHNRVRIDGVIYEVVGAPVSAWTPRGEHHLEVPLELVAG